MQLLDGKIASSFYKQEIKAKVAAHVASGKKAPHLAAIIAGNDGASEAYVGNKIKTCNEIGFESTLIRLSADVTQSELLKHIDGLNNNPAIDGFIVQMPLPKQINVQQVTEAIQPAKDVDGFHPINNGRMMQQQPCYLPATPKGILLLLDYYKIDTQGKHCVILGRSNIVGGPMSVLMSRKASPGNCTVTLCHSGSKNITHFVQQADIVIAALGQPYYVKADMIKEGAVVIDVGITRVTDTTNTKGYRLAGDVDFENVKDKCSYITPVPGGVGLMTIVGLLQNTYSAAIKEVFS
ncbi:MAG: bifunctional 5,10-methylene-tetrahydrofolate dehydrogenase/5,10-methylene-tetrahydrofolate cyclohydrolase [Bacteroidetes bacterium]|nr:bifunctional 5,10-methylene-tetrahydrofolate dehydrogenase/5,10-methylene-tetrahydrofolate cyclohydrolase [Bacteroidota bacterium]